MDFLLRKKTLRGFLILTCVAVAAFGMTGCSDDDDPVATGGGGAAPVNRVLQLDGVDGTVTIPIADHLFTTFTIEAMVKVPDYETNVHYVSLRDNAYLVLGDYGLANDGQVSTWAEGLSPINAGDDAAEPVVSADAWHHLAFSYDGTNQYILIDGSVVLTRPTTGTVAHDAVGDTEGLNIGSRFSDTSQFVVGQIDEVRLWNIYRTPAEILANINTKLPATPGLVGYWHFDGNNANDASGNGANGTLMGGATIVAK